MNCWIVVQAYSFGLQAEKKVLQVLQNRGCELLAHRYKTKYGEIDLIVSKGSTIYFLEVKARRNFDNFAIDERQLRRINDAILCFCAENEVANFQVGVMLVNKNFKLRYIKDIYLD